MLMKKKKKSNGKTTLEPVQIRGKEMASVSFKMPYEVLKKSPEISDFATMLGGRIRTFARRDQNPLPYRLATPQ